MLVKVIGAWIGFNLLSIPGAFIGWFVAGAIQRYFQFGAAAVNPLSMKQRQAVFLKTLFNLMGAMAKADGRVSESEIAHTEQVIAQLGMKDELRQQAIEHFREGAKPEFDMQTALQAFDAVCGQTHNLKQMLLVFLVGIAHADGVLDVNEERMLRQIAQALNVPAAVFEQLMQRTRSQSGFRSHQNRANSSLSALDEAYKALGVSPDMDDKQIKRAYRKLMSEFHPDKLTGQGMPEDMIQMATERSQEIQAAYDLIKENRA